MKILIAGPELSGKSKFLKKCTAEALKKHLLRICLDCDKDRKFMPLTDEFQPDVDYFIEDRNSLSKKPYYPLSMYNRIYYILPSRLTHLCFWFNAMWLWFKRGSFGHDPNTGVSDGWRGSGIPFDTYNLRPIFKEFKKRWKYRWDKMQFDIFIMKKSSIPFNIITPRITRRGIIFYFKDENGNTVNL